MQVGSTIDAPPIFRFSQGCGVVAHALRDWGSKIAGPDGPEDGSAEPKKVGKNVISRTKSMDFLSVLFPRLKLQLSGDRSVVIPEAADR